MQRLGEGRHNVAVVLLSITGEHERDLACVDVREHFGEQFVVGGGELRDPVVGGQVGQLLGLAGVVLIVDGNLRQVAQLRGHHAAVPLHDEAASLAYCDRPSPAGRPYDGGEELDLLRRVLVRVFRVWFQLLQRDDGVVSAAHRDAVGVGFRLRGRGVLGQHGARLRCWLFFCHLHSSFLVFNILNIISSFSSRKQRSAGS